MAYACRTLLLAAVCATVACSDSATSPSGGNAPVLLDGLYVMSLTGFSDSCTQLPSAGSFTTFITFSISATHSGNTWIGRPATTADGDFEVRLTRGGNVSQTTAGPVTQLDTSLIGTWTGTANDTYKYTPDWIPSGTVATFGSAGAIAGLYHGFRFSDGYASTSVTFSKNGTATTCAGTSMSWDLNGPMSNSAAVALRR